MVKPDIVLRKLGRARSRLAEAEEILAQPATAFLADTKGRDLATFYLFLAIQEAIDLAAHWVADDGLGTSEDVAGTFDLLAETGAVEPELADRLRACVGLRNRIAHGYASIDHGRIHEEYQLGIDALRRFLDRVASAAGL
jgi:uncharacterized protein YutE (UPF0331/DUF86 family)